MVWTYLAVLGDCHSHSGLGFVQSLTAKSTPIVKEYSSLRWPSEEYIMLQYGMISDLSNQGIFLLPSSISYSGASLARTSQLQEMEKAWKASEVDCFSRSYAFPKKSSPSSYSLKTCPQSPAEGEFASLEKLPKWGMIVGGVLYPLLPLAHPTKETDGSVWLGTPTANTGTKGRSPQFRAGKLPNPQEAIQMWPTPTARNPEACPAELRRHSPGLETAVQMWPTPDANARGARSNQNGYHFTIQDAVGSGKLNPVWVEWLMGYRKEWTALEPWAMQWFLSKRKRRSKS